MAKVYNILGGSSGGVESVTGIGVDNTDPLNPIVNEIINGVQTIVAGTNVTVDNTDPLNPIVSASGGGSGGSQNLNQVLTVNNQTSGKNIVVSDGDSIYLDNGSKLIKGTTDSGLGGNKGIALRCSIDYELKWEAGRLYIMEQDGFTIRETKYNFANTPTIFDDNLKGFVIGSRWVLDNGNVYKCLSASTGGASWELQSSASQNLQQVTDVGNETTNQINVLKIGLYNPPSLIYTIIEAYGNELRFNVPDSNKSYSINSNSLTLFRNYNLPDVDGTIALTSDIPSPTAILTTTITDGDTTHAPDGNSVFDALALKVDKVTGKELSANDFTNTLKTKLDEIAAGAEVNVNADWNAISGDAQILNKPSLFSGSYTDLTNKPTIPSAQVNSDWNAISGLAQILNKPTIPSISGLELQANKQNSLAVDGTGIKYPTVDAVNAGIINTNTNAIDRVTVKLATAINKGQAVYVSGANGTNIIVSKASNATESTSSKTIGLLETTGTTNDIVNVVTDGLLTGLDTSTATIGDPVWLGVSGALIYGLASKPYAPAHLVYIGVVSRVSATVGEIIVKVQNGFELREIHDVDLITTTPTNNQALIYESASSLWKNKTVDKTFVGLSNVDNTSDANKPVSSAQSTAIGLKEDSANKSTLTTDSASTTKFPVWSAILAYFDTARIKTLLGITTLSGSNTGDQDLSTLVVKNTPITGATKTKITYDAKGLVTAGADATTADIADSTNKRYVTDANLTVIGNTSGTNTGDNANNVQYSGLQSSKADVYSASSGSVISFSIPQVYNSVGSPATGNLTESLGSAKIGIVQKIYHQQGTVPSFGTGSPLWVKLGTGTYLTSALNIIYAEYVSSGRIEYWITQ